MRTVRLLCGLLAAAGLAGTAADADARGYLGARAEELPPLRIGIGEDGYGMEPKEYRLETGRGYVLTVRSTGLVECELVMREFLDNVWIRQLQAGEVEFRVPTVSAIGLDDEGEFSLTFVPIRPGRYEWACEGLEHQGLVGTFVVE
ncbi:hypothetical protein HRbin39_00855 [bacterium HR39]|nr:hypothetical protein HRbin39_00855 [bacterium HR39]